MPRPKPDVPSEIISVRVPADLLGQIDAVIEAESTDIATPTRSSVILAAVRDGLAVREKRSKRGK